MRSESFWQSGHFQNLVGRMARKNFRIDRKSLAAYRRRPDFVVSFPLPHQGASRLVQQPFEGTGVALEHQAAGFIRSSLRATISKFSVTIGVSLASKSSGIIDS